MKTIFAKYSNERLPKHQIVTKIVQDKNRKRYAIKESIGNASKKHINTIFNNYSLLKNRYGIKLVTPIIDGDQIIFDIAEGMSLEKLILQAIREENNKQLEIYFEKFIDYINKFVSKKNIIFEPCAQFKTIFGECVIDEPQDIIEIANIDMIFSNLFFQDNEFTLIDYEWVFKFEIPKSFIIWRAFNTFNLHHNINLSMYSDKELVDNHEKFKLLEENFSNFVHGKKKAYFLNDNVRKNVSSYHETKSELVQTKSELVQTKSELVQTKSELRRIHKNIIYKVSRKIHSLLKIDRRKTKSEIFLIKKSGLFDTNYYIENYPDVLKSNIEPIEHFVKYGYKENRNPSGKFDTGLYLSTYNNVAVEGINPLVHYIKYGQFETHQSDTLINPILYATRLEKTFYYVKFLRKNPQIINRVIKEIRFFGLIKTILKIKNKLYRVKEAITKSEGIFQLTYVLNFFHQKLYIPEIKTQRPIDILIPVYNGREYLSSLFDTIIKNTSIPYRLLVCDDNSSDEKVLPLLNKIKRENPDIDFVLLENSENLGFIGTINKLVGLTENHFVLLNTDVEVPEYWMQRLMYPIFEMENIATTTPFTNSGTICSFPKYLEDNELLYDLSLDEIDKKFQFIDFKQTYIEIPTGVGFCMGINKDLVDKIGMFDEIFGKGYGEENDWCQRAITKGYKNIHVTNLFVYHKHGGSFLPEEKKILINDNILILNNKHRTYEEQVKLLIEKNELSLLRKVQTYFLLESKNYSVLIFDHSLGGGASDYINIEIDKKLKSSNVICLIRYDFHISKQYIIEMTSKDGSLVLESNNLDDVSQFLYKNNFNEIIINSLVSYPNINSIINLVIELKKNMHSRIVIPVHDFFTLCPNYTLLDETTTYCEIPSNLNRCHSCLSKNKGEFKIFDYNSSIEKWRDIWGELFEKSNTIICFSDSSKDIFTKAFPNHNDKLKVIPHEISGRYEKIYKEDIHINQIRIGILGGINEAKGAIILKQLVEYIEHNNLNAKVILIGQISIPITSPFFEVTGRYEHDELPQIIKKKAITEFFIPSVCPETYSFTTDEIMQMGFPLTVFNLGAPAERVKKYSLGHIIERDDLYNHFFEQ